jgi:hypothetical protein
MKITRVLLVGVVAVAAALAGAVMLGSTTAGVKSTYYACADATTGALRRVPAEERCAEGEERLVWSDGQSEPTPAPPTTACVLEASGTWQEYKESGDLHSLFAVPGDDCQPKWVGVTTFEIEYTLTVTNFQIGTTAQGYGVANNRNGCDASTNFGDCAGLGSNAETPIWTTKDCEGQDPCVISYKAQGLWVRSPGQQIFLLLERDITVGASAADFKGTWSITGIIKLRKSP